MKVGLIGNPNSGKTTLFNLLTNMNAKIGNWPGVTIEKKTGIIKGTDCEITDLPGIYSLSPYSEEEEVSRKFVFEENPDVIINIIDATTLERSLYLTTQLMELNTKVIIALNMADVLEKKGISIDIQKLEMLLGVKVYKISALKRQGIDELIEGILKEDLERTRVFDNKLEEKILQISSKLNINHTKFVAIKLLEDDKRFQNLLTNDVKNVIENTKKYYDADLEEIIATKRYDFIEKVKKESFVKKENFVSTTDKLDKIFLNKLIAIPIFVIIMFFIYYLSVGVIGNKTIDIVENGIEIFKEIVNKKLISLNTSPILISLIVDGIIEGVGAVLGFIPQLTILFLCISILETTGYMSRIALLLDKAFRRIGLSGKSLIPFIVGSGCSVPGIMGTRIIENEDERKLTAILTPFIPCSAKLPIIVLFSGYFFNEHSGIISASLYFFAIAIIIASALIMNKIVFKKKSLTYIFELPEYKVPSIKYILKDVSDKIFSFIKRAGSTILVCSIIIWTLLSFSTTFKYGVNIENSILAEIGKKISWIFYPILGTNSWGATVSAIQGLVAKEQVVASMSVIAGFSKDVQEGSKIFNSSGIFGFFTSASAYSFMVFNLFSAPCFGAISAMKKELGGMKGMLKAITFQTVLAWVLSTIVFQIGRKIETNIISISDIIISIIILLIVITIIVNKFSKKEDECSNCPYCKDCKK